MSSNVLSGLLRMRWDEEDMDGLRGAVGGEQSSKSGDREKTMSPGRWLNGRNMNVHIFLVEVGCRPLCPLHGQAKPAQTRALKFCNGG